MQHVWDPSRRRTCLRSGGAEWHWCQLHLPCTSSLICLIFLSWNRFCFGNGNHNAVNMSMIFTSTRINAKSSKHFQTSRITNETTIATKPVKPPKTTSPPKKTAQITISQCTAPLDSASHLPPPSTARLRPEPCSSSMAWEVLLPGAAHESKTVVPGSFRWYLKLLKTTLNCAVCCGIIFCMLKPFGGEKNRKRFEAGSPLWHFNVLRLVPKPLQIAQLSFQYRRQNQTPYPQTTLIIT